MTAKEWAKKLIDALDIARRSGQVVHEHELTEAAFDEVISAEREACAYIAEAHQEKSFFAENEGPPMARSIAQAIRARGTA